MEERKNKFVSNQQPWSERKLPEKNVPLGQTPTKKSVPNTDQYVNNAGNNKNKT